MSSNDGCRIHASYLPARLLWPSGGPKSSPPPPTAGPLGEFVHLAPLGTARIGDPSAAWTGMLTDTPDSGMPHCSGTSASPPTCSARSPILISSYQAIHRSPDGGYTSAEARLVPPIADGLASNIGLALPTARPSN